MFTHRISIAIFLLIASGSRAVAQDGAAQCQLTFDAVWSAQTHPVDFPSSAHFSPLIGGIHNSDVVFWEPGAFATSGIIVMAETGATTALRNEVEDEILLGTALSVIEGGSVGQSPGTANATFDMQLSHPLVTVTTMIAPSPDWFVGVHDLPLFEGGRWVDQLIAPLLPYDAGSDSGTTFLSPNQATVPQAPIELISGFPFTGTGPLGTFEFECTSDLLFIDGFESGNTSIWSAGAP